MSRKKGHYTMKHETAFACGKITLEELTSLMRGVNKIIDHANDIQAHKIIAIATQMHDILLDIADANTEDIED